MRCFQSTILSYFVRSVGIKIINKWTRLMVTNNTSSGELNKMFRMKHITDSSFVLPTRTEILTDLSWRIGTLSALSIQLPLCNNRFFFPPPLLLEGVLTRFIILSTIIWCPSHGSWSTCKSVSVRHRINSTHQPTIQSPETVQSHSATSRRVVPPLELSFSSLLPPSHLAELYFAPSRSSLAFRRDNLASRQIPLLSTQISKFILI